MTETPDDGTTGTAILTVGELIADLSQFDPNLPVLLQTDPEGTEFFWAGGADNDCFVDVIDMDADRTDAVYSAKDIIEEQGADDEAPEPGQAVIDDTAEPLDADHEDPANADSRAAMVSAEEYEGYRRVVVVFP